jgi:hypothetical protein
MRWLVIGIFVGNSPSNTLGVRSIPKTWPRGRRSRLRLEDLPSSRLRFQAYDGSRLSTAAELPY